MIYCLHKYLNIWHISTETTGYFCPLLLQEHLDLTGHMGDLKEVLKQRPLLKVPEVAFLRGFIASGKRRKCMKEALKITLL